MAVTFKCLTSGQTVTFKAQVDIDSMKGHDGYVRVDEETQETKTTTAKNSKKTVTPPDSE